MTIELTDINYHDESVDELAKTIIKRMGLGARKRNSTVPVYKLLIEFYERSKKANQEKNPELSIMTIDDIKSVLKITRQSSYDYVNRWLEARIISKISLSSNGKLIKGYKLNGSSLENAFIKTVSKVKEHLNDTQDIIQKLQKKIKNEKIREKLISKNTE